VGDAPHEGEQLIAVERLAQVPVRAGATLELIRRDLVVRRDEHHGDRGAGGEQPIVQVEPGHAAEVHVEHETRGVAVERCAQVLMGARVRLDGDAGGSQHTSERRAHGGVVIDDGDPAALRLGRYALDGLHDAMT